MSKIVSVMFLMSVRTEALTLSERFPAKQGPRFYINLQDKVKGLYVV